MRVLLRLILSSLIFFTGAGPVYSVTDTALGGKEPYRPSYHFTPPSGWMNDPNGMVYYDGEYHLFYQYYPDDTVWGPMHWGHAVSKDLVTWTHLPIALYPDEKGYIFSGGAIVDYQNSSGLGTADNPPMIVFYTYHDPVRGKAGTKDHESQAIAYSLDKGRSWTKYEGNPVLPNPGGKQDFRDPNVFWHAPTNRWIMIVSVTDHMEIYSSKNLLVWDYESDFGHGIKGPDGVWECPDLFPLRVAGSEDIKWVLILNHNPGGPQGGSGTQYFIGDFDGKTFTLDDSQKAAAVKGDAYWLDFGPDNYAGVTWAQTDNPLRQVKLIGWMSNWLYAQQVPSKNFRSAMTLVRDIDLVKIEGQYRLRSTPVQALDRLAVNSAALKADTEGLLLSKPEGLSPVKIDLVIDQGDPQFKVGFTLENEGGEQLHFGYDPARNAYFIDRRRAGISDFHKGFAARHYAPKLGSAATMRFEIYLDNASVELRADGGLVMMSELVFPKSPYTKLRAELGVQSPALKAATATFFKK